MVERKSELGFRVCNLRPGSDANWLCEFGQVFNLSKSLPPFL